MVKGVIFHEVTWLRLNFTASYSLIVLSFFTVATFGTANLRRQGVKNSGFLGLFWTMANYFHWLCREWCLYLQRWGKKKDWNFTSAFQDSQLNSVANAPTWEFIGHTCAVTHVWLCARCGKIPSVGGGNLVQLEVLASSSSGISFLVLLGQVPSPCPALHVDFSVHVMV